MISTAKQSADKFRLLEKEVRNLKKNQNREGKTKKERNHCPKKIIRTRKLMKKDENFFKLFVTLVKMIFRFLSSRIRASQLFAKNALRTINVFGKEQN